MIQETKYFKIYNFANQLKGDTFSARQFALTDEDGVAISLVSATFLIQFRVGNANGTVIKTITTTSGMTVTDAAGGKFTISAFLCSFPVGVYYYDCQITFASGEVHTYFGGTMNVVNDTSKL
ncbi:hypothetical protein [Massilibacteroides sp.]|uniref:hypothetical protein n=1 Tax=Massilibacteroides sp. TaxID=2034766 RepID=UPI00263420D1|nr:hypothetical protein [Massilibacteroides sp.]MDD4515634.1 hypothetical protein [Massilibacteroides sp.]